MSNCVGDSVEGLWPCVTLLQSEWKRNIYTCQTDWCLIHQFKTVALLTVDSGRWRLFRVYNPSLTLSGDTLLEWLHLCTCVCMSSIAKVCFFMNVFHKMCCYFYLPSCLICLHIYCTCVPHITNSCRGSVSLPPDPAVGLPVSRYTPHISQGPASIQPLTIKPH